MASLCSLQGLRRPGDQCHPRLCSLQRLVDNDEINEIPVDNDEINVPDIFYNLDDGEDQDIDLNHYLDIINVDNDNNNDVLLPDIFYNLDDGEDQDIDLNHYLDIIKMLIMTTTMMCCYLKIKTLISIILTIWMTDHFYPLTH
jgi:hypothetical protein